MVIAKIRRDGFWAHHEDAAIRFKRKEFQGCFASTFKWLNILILAAIFYGVSLLEVINLSQNRIQNAASLSPMQYKRLLPCFNLQNAIFDNKRQTIPLLKGQKSDTIFPGNYIAGTIFWGSYMLLTSFGARFSSSRLPLCVLAVLIFNIVWLLDKISYFISSMSYNNASYPNKTLVELLYSFVSLNIVKYQAQKRIIFASSSWPLVRTSSVNKRNQSAILQNPNTMGEQSIEKWTKVHRQFYS